MTILGHMTFAVVPNLSGSFGGNPTLCRAWNMRHCNLVEGRKYKIQNVACGIGHAKAAESIELPFGLCVRWGQGIVYNVDVHIGATWRIRLNDSERLNRQLNTHSLPTNRPTDRRTDRQNDDGTRPVGYTN